MDEVIEDKDKTMVLLSSLSDDRYETFVLTLINRKSSLSYVEVTTALVNLDLKRKDKESFNGTSAEELTMRQRSPNQRGEICCRSKSRSRFDNHSLSRDQSFCELTGH